MSKILVLLSTYNGAKYLCDQIDSIIAQKDADVTILIRDDGSSDHTIELLQSYHKKFHDKIILELADNVGCTGSFFTIMKLAAEKYVDYDYYAFSDQDDVWLPDKMSVAAKALDAVDNNIKLYYCCPELVDSKLNPIKSNPLTAKNTLEEAFILQPAIGCSMVFSKDLLKKAAIVNPADVNIHDAWIFKVCLALGGEIVYDPTPHILYRQHSSNAIGRTQGFRKKWRRRFKLFFDSKCIRSGQAKLLLSTYNLEIPQKEKAVLLKISNYHNSLKDKGKIIFNNSFTSNYRLHNLMFKIAILFGKL